MLFGARKAAVKGLLWARICWLALRAYRNPRRAISSVRRMAAARAGAQRFTVRKYARVSGRYFWDLYAPGFPSRAFDRVVERELDRVEPFLGAPPALQTAIVAITRRCGLRCEHCCEWDVLNGPEALSGSDLREIVERLQRRGVAQFFLSGGEPLRRYSDLVELVRAASTEADVWILTSGQGLTVERATQLREAGLTGVSLSLDHWDQQRHDRFRGLEGAFGWVERAAANARRAGLVVAVSLCATREFTTAVNLERYADLARRLGASFIQLLEPKAVGHYAGADVALPPRQQRLLEAFADRVNFSAACRELPAVAYLDFENRRTGCTGAADRYIYVDTDGTLHPCPFCRSPSGSVLGGDLDDALAGLRNAGCPATMAIPAPATGPERSCSPPPGSGGRVPAPP
jgi:MoaA/NifB/PqqE/SkfB family radical SAM enzyme